MQKRGSLTHNQLFQIIGITLVMGIVAFMYMYADFVVNDSTYERSMLSRDIVLLSNTIISSPADINYNYTTNIDITHYDLKFIGYEIAISDQGLNNFVYKFFFLNNFFSNKLGWGVEQYMNYITYFWIQKQGHKYSIGPEIENPSLYICPYIPTNTNQELKVLLDSLLDEDTLGSINTHLDIQANEINKLIIDSIILILENEPELNVEMMSDSSITDFSLENRQDKILDFQPNITIIINITSIDNEENLAKIYYHSNNPSLSKSLKLSCFIANNFKENLNLTTILIPRDVSLDSGILSILDLNNQPTIFIEISNIQLNENNIFQDNLKISEAIADAIKQYR